MSADEPFVSVVTPFYNAEPYLAECIESVLGQTHRRFEYILVDNCSTDRSGRTAESYARRDSRIRLIRADRFRSQLENFNYSIQQLSSTSAYVKFALADDWLYPRCLTELVELAEANPRVGVVSSYELKDNKVYGSGLPARQNVLSGRDACRLCFLKWIYLFGTPTTVLYRGEVVRARTPFFPEALHSDTEAVFQILTDHDFGFVHQVLSFTRTQDDSITGRARDLADTALDRYIIVKRFGHFYLEPSEYDDCFARTVKWYYDDLGRRWISQWMGKRSEEFWAFHRKGLATIDESIEWNRVVRATIGILIEKLLNPGHSVRKLREKDVLLMSPTRKSGI